MSKCPTCSSSNSLREIVYGMPSSEIDETKFVIGGCCVSDSDPTVRCNACGWEGEFKNHISNLEDTLNMAELKPMMNMNDSELDEYAKTLWGKLTNNGKGRDEGDSKS
jgi:hypothetical protein